MDSVAFIIQVNKQEIDLNNSMIWVQIKLRKGIRYLGA